MSEFEIPILLSSATASGAYNVSPNGDKFDVSFDQEIKIPKLAKQITVEVTNASIWFTTFNISAALGNNRFYLDVSGDVVYEVILDDGLYDMSSLAHSINVSLVNQGLASDILTFTADVSTQRIVINFSRAGLRVDFSQPATCRIILGFASAVTPVAYTTAITSVYGTTVAAFNTIDYFLIHSDIVRNGISVNGKQSNVIARVLITAAPNSQILYTPHEATRIPADNLVGANIANIHSWVTDDRNNGLNFNDEIWSVSFTIRYTM